MRLPTPLRPVGNMSLQDQINYHRDINAANNNTLFGCIFALVGFLANNYGWSPWGVLLYILGGVIVFLGLRLHNKANALRGEIR